MIVCDQVTISGRRGRPLLDPLTATFAEGVFALVGPSEDGGALFLEVLAGASSPRAGDATLLGARPRPRPDVVWVPLVTELPPACSVGELFERSALLRGGASDSPQRRLDRFGVSSLETRRVHTLDPVAAHTVALVEALTSQAKVLLLEEPLSRIDARAAGAVVEAIRAKAKSMTVLVATASSRDAHALGAEVWSARGGAWSRALGADQAEPWGAGVRALRVTGADLRPLAAALASDKRAETLSWSGADLLVSGRDPSDVAAAIGETIASAGVTVDLLEPVMSP